MKTITISDAAAQELLTALQGPAVIPEPVVVHPEPVVVHPEPIHQSAFTHVLHLALPAWTIGGVPNRHLYTADVGHMGSNDAVVVAITAPLVLGTDAFGSFGWSDVGGDPIAQRRVVLSDEPLDFDRGIPGTGAIVPGAETASITFSAGPNGYGYPALTVPGRTYYFNIKNAEYHESPTGHFDLDLEFRNPR